MIFAESDQAQLLEIFRKGAGKCSETLAAVSGAPWNIHIISLDVGTGDRFLSLLARDSREYWGIFFSNPGETYLAIISEESGRALVNASPFAKRGKRPMTQELERSALTEIANIFISRMSNLVAERHGMARIISGPTVTQSRKSCLYAEAFGLSHDQEPIVDVLVHVSSPELAADVTVMVRLDPTNTNFLLNTDPDARSADTARAAKP